MLSVWSHKQYIFGYFSKTMTYEGIMCYECVDSSVWISQTVLSAFPSSCFPLCHNNNHHRHHYQPLHQVFHHRNTQSSRLLSLKSSPPSTWTLNLSEKIKVSLLFQASLNYLLIWTSCKLKENKIGFSITIKTFSISFQFRLNLEPSMVLLLFFKVLYVILQLSVSLYVQYMKITLLNNSKNPFLYGKTTTMSGVSMRICDNLFCFKPE